MLQVVDQMDGSRIIWINFCQGIGLRGYGQRDPVVEYKLYF